MKIQRKSIFQDISLTSSFIYKAACCRRDYFEFSSCGTGDFSLGQLV